MSAVTAKTYRIEGMTCGHCERAVGQEVEALNGIVAAEADSQAGTLVVRGSMIDDRAVAGAVAEAGYEVRP